MNAQDTQLVQKGQDNYDSLTLPEQERYEQLREQLMTEMYDSLPSEIKSQLQGYIATLDGDSIEYYRGFMEGMVWYRSLLSATLPPEALGAYDIFHMPLFVTLCKSVQSAKNKQRSTLEGLLPD